MKKFNLLGIFTLIVIVCLFAYNTTVSRAVDPEVTTSLALEQFADPSTETDTALRVWNTTNLTPWVNGAAVVLLGGVWLGAYRKELGGLWNEVVD